MDGELLDYTKVVGILTLGVGILVTLISFSVYLFGSKSRCERARYSFRLGFSFVCAVGIALFATLSFVDAARRDEPSSICIRQSDGECHREGDQCNWATNRN